MAATLEHNAHVLNRANRYLRRHALDIPIEVGDEDPARWNAYLDFAARYRELAETFDAWAKDQGLI